jgi:hypothetical protein
MNEKYWVVETYMDDDRQSSKVDRRELINVLKEWNSGDWHPDITLEVFYQPFDDHPKEPLSTIGLVMLLEDV